MFHLIFHKRIIQAVGWVDIDTHTHIYLNVIKYKIQVNCKKMYVIQITVIIIL